MQHDQAPEQGTILVGKYQVERVLGQGGMGVVVAARHLVLDERVAIKFLLPEVAQNADVVRRFLREAQAAVRIRSEHVARVIDVGTMETGQPYIVMEHLSGEDLSAALERGGPLPMEQAVEYVLQTCEALADAHSLGIVHRDIKPANLFVTRRNDGSPSIKVLDFGISKVTGGSSQALTQTRGMMGSPLYMSPEQLTSPKEVDHRADVYALGVVLFELLTGRQPFEGDELPQLIVKIIHAEPIPLRHHRPDLPAALEAAIQSCLLKDRTQRIQSVAELASALTPFAPPRCAGSAERTLRIAQSREQTGTPRSSAPPGTTLVPLGGTNPPPAPLPGRRTTVAVAGGLVTIAMLGGIAFGALSLSRSHDESKPTAAAGSHATPMPQVVELETDATSSTTTPRPAATTQPAKAAVDTSAEASAKPASSSSSAAKAKVPAAIALPKTKSSGKSSATSEDPFGSHIYESPER